MNFLLPLHAIFFLCLLVFCTPFDLLGMEPNSYEITKEIRRFNDNTSNQRVMEFTAGFNIEGLWGPVPKTLPALAYLEKAYPTDTKESLSHPLDTGPFLKISAYQVKNQPVIITVNVPQAEELGTLTSDDGDTYWFVRPVERRILFNQILKHDYHLSDYDQLIQLQIDEVAGSIRWTPTAYEYLNRSVTVAPVLIEVLVVYDCMHGMTVKNNPKASWEEATSYTLRIGWLMLPPCGDLTGDSIVICPSTFPPVASWKNHNLGDITISVPNNWFQDLSPQNDQGQWEIDSAKPETAGIILLRDQKLEKLLENMESGSPEKVTLNGEQATRYSGRITKKNLDSALYVFDRKDGDGRKVMLGLVAADWQTAGPFLEAIANSITFGPEALQPSIAADLTSQDNGGQLVIGSAPASSQKLEAPATREQVGTTTIAEPATYPERPNLQDASPPEKATPSSDNSIKATLSAQFVRKKTAKDYVGRNEDLKGNGAADSRIRVRITAPGKTIAAIRIQSTEGLEAAWDTIPGNDRWLIAATNGQELLNKEDGSMHYPLPDGELKFDLWVQDNNAIASTKTKLNLIIEMADGGKIETTVAE